MSLEVNNALIFRKGSGKINLFLYSRLRPKPKSKLIIIHLSTPTFLEIARIKMNKICA